MIHNTNTKYNKQIFTIPIDNNFLEKDEKKASNINPPFDFDDYLCPMTHPNHAKTKISFTSLLKNNWKDIVISNKVTAFDIYRTQIL